MSRAHIASVWFNRRIANAISRVRDFPKSETAKKWARYGAAAVATAGLIAGTDSRITWHHMAYCHGGGWWWVDRSIAMRVLWVLTLAVCDVMAVLYGAGGLWYSPSFRRHTAAQLLPLQTFRTNYIQHHRKQSLFQSLPAGRVLELGPGAGANFAYFPAYIQWTGVETNPELAPKLYAAAEKAGTPPAVLDLQITDQSLPKWLSSQPSNSMDAVVSTYVLCSVPESEYRDVIAHVHRVLKPGGRFYFIESVTTT